MIWVPGIIDKMPSSIYPATHALARSSGQAMIHLTHAQASATPQNVMNMAEMASKTAQLWLESAESEPSHPERALPAPDPYNQAFYSFTRKDPDNEVRPISNSEQRRMKNGEERHSFVFTLQI